MAFSKQLTNGQAARNAIYNIFMKRTSTYFLTIVGAGFIGVDLMYKTNEYIWNMKNVGVKFENIHDTFPELEADEED